MARLGTTRLRHVVGDGSGATCVAFSPDGKTVVSGGDVGLRAWDTATGKDLGWFPTAAPATSAQFTADGKTLLTTDNSGTLRLWQAGTGNLLRETKQHQDNRSFHGSESCLSADGKVVGILGSSDGVCLWDTKSGKRILSRKDEHRSLGFSAALTPDGKTLAVSGEENRAYLVEVASDKVVRRIEGPYKATHLAPGFARMREESLYWFAFSPDGKSLAGVSGKGSFCVWNVADGRLRYSVKNCRGRLAFSPDGKQLICAGEEAMRLYEAQTGKEVRLFERHPGHVYALAFSPDGKTVASAQRYTIDLWDVATGRRRHPFAGHATPVVRLAFSPDGSSLASGDIEEGTLIVWSLKDRKPRHTFRGHYPSVLSVAFSPDGKVLASGDGYNGSGEFDARVRLWDPSAGKLLRQFPGHLTGIESLAFSPDGKRLASTGGDARAKVWNVSTGKRLLQIRGEDATLWSVAFSPDGKTLLVAGSPGELALWRLDSGRKVRDLGTPGDESRGITIAGFLPDGRTVWTREYSRGNSRTNKVLFWGVQDGRPLRSFSLVEAGSSQDCSALSPDGNTLAVGGGYRDSLIRLWDTNTGKRAGQFSGHNGGPATSLAFSPDGKRLASGGPDTAVLLWDVTRARFEQSGPSSQVGRTRAPAPARRAATPEEAIPFLKDRLRRVARAEDRARGLIVDLEDDDFHAREKASGAGRPGPRGRVSPTAGTPGLSKAERAVASRVHSSRRKTHAENTSSGRKKSCSRWRCWRRSARPSLERALEVLAKGPAKTVVAREAGAALERLAQAPQR